MPVTQAFIETYDEKLKKEEPSMSKKVLNAYAKKISALMKKKEKNAHDGKKKGTAQRV